MPQTKSSVLMNNPFSIRAAGDAAAELFIYGDIGDNWWGESVTAKDVAEQLSALDVETITVRINSYGGSVSDGLAIFNALKRHKAQIDVVIDGVAVSIASLIAMAGDTVSAGENVLFMVHAPWGGMWGNAKDMREYADLLDKFASSMSTSYARKTGRDADEVLALLTDGEDHWYSAAEALEFGFIDQIVELDQPAADEDDDGEDLATDASAMMAQFMASRFGAAATTFAASRIDRFKPPAAPVAATPTKERNMPEKKNPATIEPEKIDDVKAQAKAEAMAAEKERKSGIRAAFSPFVEREGVRALLDTCIDDDKVSAADAQTKLLALLGKDSGPLAIDSPDVRVTETSLDKFRKGAQASLMAKSGLAKDDTGNEFRSYSLSELAREMLAMHQVDTGRMDKMSMVAAAFTHSSSDFGNLLANVAHKAMMRGFEEAEETFQKWTNPGVLTDFKATKRVDLTSFPSLLEVKEGGEFKHGTFGDRGETITLATYGRLFSITRQAIINDDLSAFTKIPMKMGRAAIRTVGDLVYAVLTGNPTMADGTALFHADHNNLGTGGGISTASVEEMRKLMALQTDNSAGANGLNIPLAYLMVPQALSGTARTVANSEFEVGASSKNNTTPNIVRGTFEVVADARLDAASATQWYGAANPAMHDTIEVAYLDGNQAPMLEQQSGWNVDGVEFKVRMDAGVKALAYQTLARNAGS